MTNICPLCGYPNLYKPPYRGEYKGGVGSYEICRSCGFQFGVTGYDTHISHDQWRQKWIEGGMVWRTKRGGPPPGWDAKEQLLNIGVKI